MKRVVEINSIPSNHTVCLAIIGLLSLMLLTGCVVQSLTPFYEEGSVIRMPQLEGEWRLIRDAGKDVSKEKPQPWTVRANTVRTFDSKGVASPLKITFFKVGATTFVDVTADTPDEASMNRWWLFHVAPVHTVCKVIVGDDRLFVIPLSPYWMKEGGKGNNLALPHIRPMKGEDLDVYYPSPALWMKFLKDYLHDKEAFPDNGRREFLRINPP